MILLVLTLVVWGIVLVITRDRTKIAFEYYPNKKIKSKRSYVKVNKERIFHGPTVYYNEEGAIESEMNFKGGLLDGVLSKFDENGKLVIRELYRHGSRVVSFKY